MAVAFGVSGAIVYSTGNPAPSYPGGITAGQLLILEVRTKPDTTPATTPSGWTSLGAYAGGAGSQGIDTGPTRVGIFYKIANGTESGSVTVTVTGNNVSSAQIHRYTKTLTDWNIDIAGGVDTTGGAAFSVVTNSVPAGFIAAGDMLHIVNTFPTDTAPSWGTLTLTAQGGGSITLGTPTTMTTASTASGQDLGGRTVRVSPTASTQAAGTLTLSSTLTGTTTNTHGPLAIVRLRDQDPVPPTAPTSAPVVTNGNEVNTIFTPAAAGGATSYDIYGNGSLVAQAVSPSGTYNHTDPAVVTTGHTYTLRARNSAGVSSDSPASASSYAAPLPPSYTLSSDDSKVTVNITRRAYDAVYKVYRGLAGGARSLVHTSTSQVANGTYTWENTGLTNGTTYDYHVTTSPQTPVVRESTASSVQSATPNIIITTYLYPINDYNVSGFTTQSGGTTNLYQTIDDPHGSPNTADYITSTTTTASYLTSLDWPDISSVPEVGIVIDKTATTGMAWELTYIDENLEEQTIASGSLSTQDVNYALTSAELASLKGLVPLYEIQLRITTAAAGNRVNFAHLRLGPLTETYAYPTSDMSFSGMTNETGGTTALYQSIDDPYDALNEADYIVTTATANPSYRGNVSWPSGRSITSATIRLKTSTASPWVLQYFHAQLGETLVISGGTTTAGVITEYPMPTLELDDLKAAIDSGYNPYFEVYPPTGADQRIYWLHTKLNGDEAPSTTPIAASDTLSASVTDVASVAKQDTYIRRVNATTSNTFGIVNGSTAHGVVSDNNDTSYIQGTTNSVTSQARLQIPDTAAPASGFWPSVRVRYSYEDEGGSAYFAIEERGFASAVFMAGNLAVDTGGGIIERTYLINDNSSITDWSALDLYLIDEPGPVTNPLRVRDIWVEIPGPDPVTPSTPIAASDTLGASVSDVASVVVTSVAKTASDTLSAIVTDAGTVPPQPQTRYAVADGLVQGTWTGSYLDVDETVANDADFIESPASPSATDFYTIVFGAAEVPGTGPQKFRFRYAKSANAGKTINLIVNVRTGNDTQIAAINVGEVTSDVYTTYEYTLSQAEMDAIVDYSDVRLRFDPTASGGGAGRAVRISWAEMEIPAAQTGTVNKSRTDTLTASVSETAQFGTVSLATSDGLNPFVTDTSQIGTIAIVASDTLSASVTENRSFGTVAVAGADSLSARLSAENISFATVAVVASDTLSSSVTEARSFGTIAVTGTDTLSASVADAVSTLRATFTAADNTNASVAETAQFGTVAVSASDTMSARLSSETASFATVAVVASDSTNTVVSESAVLFVQAPGADALIVSVSETTDIQISGQVDKAASDTPTASVSESVSFATVAVTGADTLSSSVSETVQTRASRTITDNLNASVADSGVIDISGLVTKAASDTASASVSEATFFSTVAVTGSDTNSASVTETVAFNTQPVEVSDTLSVAVTDTGQFATVAVVGSDSLNVSLAETTQFATVAVAASDTNRATVTEVANTFVNRPGTDSTLASVTESSLVDISGQVNKTASDGLNVSLGDVGQFATVAVTGTDTPTASLTDSVSFSNVTLSASDSLTASVSESMQFGTIPQAASDTLSASVSESIQFATVVVTGSDNLSAAVTETSGFGTGFIVASDSLSASVSESTTFATVAVTGADNPAAAVTENTQFATVSVAASDTNTVSASETGIVLAAAPGADGLNVQLSETSNIDISGDVSKAASDTMSVSLGESVATFVTRTASDTLTTNVSESYSFQTIAVSGSDALTASVSEASQFATVAVTGNDTETVTLSENTSFATVSVTATDTLSLSVTETREFATIPMVASDTLSVSLTENRNFGTVQVVASDALTSTVADTMTLRATFASAETATVSVSDVSSFATTAVVGEETLTATATDESSTAKTFYLSLTDTLSAQLFSENVYFETIPITASDSLAAAVTETSLVNLGQPGTDVMTVTLTEVSAVEISGGVSLEASDSLSVGMTETAEFATVQVTGSETLTTQFTESVEFATVAVVGEDTLNLSVSDTGEFATVEVSSSESLNVSLAETISFNTQPITASDSLAGEVTETTQFSTVTVTGSDNLNAGVAETSQFATVAVVAEDTNSLNVTENTQFATVAVTASDQTNVSMTDAALVHVMDVGSDALIANVTEQTVLEISGGVEVSASDTATVTMAETSQFSTTAVAGAETLTVSLTDTGEFSTTEVTASDSLSARATETGDFNTSTAEASDTLSVGFTDYGQVTNVTLTVSDSLNVALSETTEFETVTVTASDNLSVNIVDNGNTFVDFPGGQVLIVSLVEASDLQVSGGLDFSSSDNLTVAVTDNATVSKVFVTSTDILAAGVTESGEFATVNVVASDDLTLAVGDSVTTLSKLPGHDGLGVTVSEETYLLKMVDGVIQVYGNDYLFQSVEDVSTIVYGRYSTDSLSLNVTESSSFETVIVTSSDTLSARVTETRDFAQTAVAASDTLSASVNDVHTLAPIQITATDLLRVEQFDGTEQTARNPGSDNLSMYVSDQGTVEISGVVEKTGSDILAANVNDLILMGTVILHAEDTLLVVQHTGMNFDTIDLLSSDSLNVEVTDSVTLGETLELSSSDTLTAMVAEDNTFGLAFTDSDTLAASVSETTDIKKKNLRIKETEDWVQSIESAYFSGYQGKTRRDRRKPTQ